MNVRYRVELDQCERDQLTALLSGGKRGAQAQTRADSSGDGSRRQR